MESFETALAEATNPTTRELLGAIGLVVDRTQNQITGKPKYHHAAGHQSLAPAAPPLDPDSIVTLGSAGKFITHIAALQCVDRGLVGLDQPLGAWIPELDALEVIFEPGHGDEDGEVERGWALRPPACKITLRHLLTHTSGLGGGDEPLVQRWRASPAGAAHADAAKADPNPFIQRFAHPLLFDPGASYCYGNSIFFTGLLIARLTGKKLPEFVQKNVFDPLGMRLSTFSPHGPEFRERLLQMVRRPTAGGLVPVEGETRDVSCGVRDLGVLLADLIGESSKILKPESVDLLFAPQLAEGGKALADLVSDTENYTAPAGIPSASTVPEVNWTMAGLLVQGDIDTELPLSLMPPGTVTWSGMPNVMWAMNRERGVGMLFATQLVPVDDPKTVGVMMEFFRGAWGAFRGS
ncbi:beta-lactamase/transpeptidase-like protein [Mycena sp. CBHHK59/15]|nr:beta-lactamase/transpeptidase-like protein [Mycena sp. CBHHK59/15]